MTGGATGIGRAIALHLGKEGAKVVINGRQEDQLLKTAGMLKGQGISVAVFNGDVANPEDCRRMVKYAEEVFGGVDILVNNAGIGSRGLFEETSPEVFRQLLDVNVLGSVYPTIEAVSALKRSRGSIIFISSLAGFRGLPNRSPYSMTKMAQTSLAESLRIELGVDGVHVGIVYVGATRNDPEKKVINGAGTWTGLRPREGFLIDTQDEVARTVLKSISRRKFKTIVGLQGATYFYIHRFFPGLVDFVFRRGLKKIQKMDF